MKKIRYYDDYNADFDQVSSGKIKKMNKHNYADNGILYRVCAFVLYRIIATPIAFAYTKIILREKIVGKRKLKGKKGYCLYCVHNNCIGDAFTPSVIAFPRRTYVVVHPDNLSVPLVGSAIPMLGAIPLPHDIKSIKEFTDCIGRRLKEGGVVTIYPEGHVWHGYNGVRPFANVSLDFPLRFNAEVFTAVRTYKKMWYGYRAVTYIDGPFLKKDSLTKRENMKLLHDEIYGTMCKRTLFSDYSPIEYVNKNTQQTDREELK